MFVGHGLVAFAIVGFLAHRFGASADRALLVAAAAGAFATLPDVDILYGPVGLLGGVANLGDAVDTFWTTGNVVHRGPTHSLVVGAVAAGGFALCAHTGWLRRLAGGTVLVSLVGVTAATSGGLDAVIVMAFVLVGVAIVAAARRLDLSARTVLATALVGLLTHPFGDMLAGAPPALFYPFDVVLVSERIVLHGDPTLHLLGAFAVEMTAIWLGVLVFLDLTDRRLAAAVDRRAAIGGMYGAAVFVLPAPTVDTASPFVFSVLSLGLVGVLPTGRRTSFDPVRTVVTGLAAVTIAAAAFTVTYLLV